MDPVRDIEIIHEELRLKDEEMIAPIIDKLEKTAVRGGDKKLKPEYVSTTTFLFPSASALEPVICHFSPVGYHDEGKELGGG